jgi:hypothetical protein
MNVFVSFNQDRQPVMSVEYCPVRSNLQRARLTGEQRRFQCLCREPPEQPEFDRIQQILRMKEP